MKRHLFALLLTLSVGCANLQGPIFTESRVESVGAIVGYGAAKAAILKGYRAEVSAARDALAVAVAADRMDLAAVGASLSAGGVPWVSTEEGTFTVGAGGLIFADLWAATGEKLLSAPLSKAAQRGLLRGVNLALGTAQSRAVASPDATLARLRAEAIATRKGKP